MKAPRRSERKPGTLKRWYRDDTITFRLVSLGRRAGSIREGDLDEVVVKHRTATEIGLAL